jgi:hypothetical protein
MLLPEEYNKGGVTAKEVENFTRPIPGFTAQADQVRISSADPKDGNDQGPAKRSRFAKKLQGQRLFRGQTAFEVPEPRIEGIGVYLKPGLSWSLKGRVRVQNRKPAW